MSNGSLLVFARAPVPGRAKTRLIPELGAEGAAALHARLCHQTLKTACGLDDTRLELWCSPDCNHAFFRQCAEDYPLVLRTQQGKDLGQRMQRALALSLKKSPWAIIIGTDCPGLSTTDLRQAREILVTHDAVLGPAQDGGYYLMGLKRAPSILFTDIPWGSREVAELTRQRMGLLNWEWDELRWQHDLDRPEDLLVLDEYRRKESESNQDNVTQYQQADKT